MLAILLAAMQAQADKFAANVLPLIEKLRATGTRSANAIAGQLNDRGIKTARGGKWSHVQVGHILRRAAPI